MAWPTTEDLKDYLIASGLYSDPPSAVQSRLDLEGALLAAIEKWNDLTHYWPFVSTGNVNETRYFDAPTSYLLDLNGGLLQMVSVATDQVYEPNYSNTVNNSLSVGTERLNLRDFRLEPADAPMRGKPYTYLRLGWVACGVPGSIAIMGEWGYCTADTVPYSAKRGVLAIAAGMLMPQIMHQLTRGGLVLLQRGDETKKWADPVKMAEAWSMEWRSSLIAGDYVRRRISS